MTFHVVSGPIEPITNRTPFAQVIQKHLDKGFQLHGGTTFILHSSLGHSWVEGYQTLIHPSSSKLELNPNEKAKS